MLEIAVRVPFLIEGIIGDELHAGFDQPPGQQQRLAELVPAVAIARRGGLAAQIEARAHAPVGDQFVGAFEKPIVAAVQVALDQPRRGVELLHQAHPTLEPVGGDPRGHRERERPISGRRRIPFEQERIVNASQKAPVLPRHPVRRAGDTEPIGHRDAPRNAGSVGFEIVEHRSGAGKVVAPRLAVAIRLIVRAGQRDVRAGDVIGELVRHRADDAEPIGDFRRTGEQFAQFDAGHDGLDRRERTADFRRGGRFWIP